MFLGFQTVVQQHVVFCLQTSPLYLEPKFSTNELCDLFKHDTHWRSRWQNQTWWCRSQSQTGWWRYWEWSVFPQAGASRWPPSETSRCQEDRPTPSGYRGTPLCQRQETGDYNRRTEEKSSDNIDRINNNYSCKNDFFDRLLYKLNLFFVFI